MQPFAQIDLAVVHPYYKLQYIEKKWGGAEEQQAEVEAGNYYAINWQEHARKTIEDAVSVLLLRGPSGLILLFEMA